MNNWDEIKKIKGREFLFTLETSQDAADYLKYEEMRNEIWDDPLDNLSSARNMESENYFINGTSLYIGVFVKSSSHEFKRDREHMVGFSYGHAGVKDKKIGFRSLKNLSFYSQFTGVTRDYYNYGLGIFIKEYQKKVVKDLMGIKYITCTFDPLTGINAYRNIHRFKMDVIEYKESCYGEFVGNLNRADIPTDRFSLSWDLEKEAFPQNFDLFYLIDSGHCVVTAETKEVLGKSGPLVLELVSEVNLNLTQNILLVEIPIDFYQMLHETDVQEKKVRRIPYEWRIQTRAAFQTLMARDYKIIDFRQVETGVCKRDFYILSR